MLAANQNHASIFLINLQMTVFYGMKGDQVICFHINASRYLISLNRHGASNTLHRLEFIENGRIKQGGYGQTRACLFASPRDEVSATI